MQNPTPRARTQRTLLVSLLLVALGCFSLPAFADELDDARDRGLVGEQLDGYLGVVPSNPPASVKKLASRINAARLEKYRGIADKRGTSVEAVAALAGRKLIERARPGTYVQAKGGGWVMR